MDREASSFGMAALAADLKATDEALKAFNEEIKAYQRERATDDAKWLEAEAAWLEELRELREATGGDGGSDDLLLKDGDEAAEKQYWTTSRQYREVFYAGCCDYSDDEEEEDSKSKDGYAAYKASLKKPSTVEVILEQRHFKGKLYYRVKWRDADVVSWEDANELKAIGALHAAVMAIVHGDGSDRFLTSSDRKKAAPDARFVEKMRRNDFKLRPAVYINNRALVRSGAERPADASFDGVWTCEVERNVYVPYDSANNAIIDKAYRSGNSSATITINYSRYTIDFGRMEQLGGTCRRVQRHQQIPERDLRKRIDDMSLQELRDYLSTVVEFTDVHYEALMRLHEEDKVRTHLSRDELAMLPTLSYAELRKELGVVSGGAGDSGSAVDDTTTATSATVATPTSGVATTSTASFACECAICLDEYEEGDTIVRMPVCGHLFHKRCAADYFSRFSKLCPYCKEEVF